MAQLFPFALMKITEGEFKGRRVRLLEALQGAPTTTNVVIDERVGVHGKLAYHFRNVPIQKLEFVDMSQPSNEFMSVFHHELGNVLVKEMNKSIKAELILERISILGELYDLVVLQRPGWQSLFWKKFVGFLGPKRKKRPKSATKMC